MKAILHLQSNWKDGGDKSFPFGPTGTIVKGISMGGGVLLYKHSKIARTDLFVKRLWLPFTDDLVENDSIEFVVGEYGSLREWFMVGIIGLTLHTISNQDRSEMVECQKWHPSHVIRFMIFQSNIHPSSIQNREKLFILHYLDWIKLTWTNVPLLPAIHHHILASHLCAR